MYYGNIFLFKDHKTLFKSLFTKFLCVILDYSFLALLFLSRSLTSIVNQSEISHVKDVIYMNAKVRVLN